jgi:hypothetical protein
MKQRIITNWNLVRFLRLVIGLAAAIQGILQREVVVTIAGLFLFSTAIFNYGCCGSGGCSVSYPSKENKTIQLEKEPES